MLNHSVISFKQNITLNAHIQYSNILESTWALKKALPQSPLPTTAPIASRYTSFMFVCKYLFVSWKSVGASISVTEPCLP